jgi:hypothetical protein
MSVDKRWTVMLAACGGAALALAFSSRRKHKRGVERKAQKADLHEWENEGGNLAPPLTLPDSAVAADSA